MIDANDEQQVFLNAVKPVEAAAVSAAAKLDPQTPSPRKRFTRKNHKPTSTYEMFSTSLEQEIKRAAELERATQLKRVAEIRRAAEAQTESPSEEAAVAGRLKRQCRPRQFFVGGNDAYTFTVRLTEHGTAHSGGISAGVAEHVAAHEVVSGGAAQGIGADAANTVTAEQQAADNGARSESPRAAGHAAASAAFGAQHAGLQAGSIASVSAVPQGMQRAKRAAVEEGGKDVKRRKGINNTRLLSDSNDSIAEAMQLDIHTNTDMSMRRTVRRRAVKERC